MENKVCYLCIMEYIQLYNYNGEKGMFMYNGVYTIM